MLNFIALELVASGAPETKTFNDGKSITSIRACLNQGYYGKNNEWIDQGAVWFTVEASASGAAKQLSHIAKGMRFVVCGYFQRRFWTDKQGVERQTDMIRATSIGQLVKASQSASGSYTASPVVPMGQPSNFGVQGDPWAQAPEPEF